ncbi:diacylglycerol kinase eta [Ochlerotatus camptorhynchus]|uniref:diacylglycerol kinase eta n=1 Tax=Ochlerotatus camptorhynchus TaxID=644619 RepID=UPI0031DDAD70
MAEAPGSPRTGDESSESENETEPAKIFHRKLSTKKDVKSAAATKEGYLMKQTWSFQRWRRRYFRLKGHKLYYAKDSKSELFDEIDLSDLCFAECSTKNANHSFQLITPTRSLVLCAENRREMEDWLHALKAASSREFFEPGPPDQHDFLSGHHNWYATSHARPTYCNVCREALSGVTSHGLSCEVCKCKVHKRCAAKAISNCKWTTLASVGKDIIEDIDGNIVMPHQWMEGNLPVSAKCIVCDKTCGSVMRLQDWRCLWCRSTVHTACRPQAQVACPLGPARVSVVPPISLHSIGIDDAWDVCKPHGSFSPLLVFVNSKSGDNQGVKFLRRFKQLLNPAQVFDLISTGPGLGLRLFRHFDPFRILICSGDGSVGWVLSEIDQLNMTKQCQIAVLPLGTGNDLARVLGWGSSCDDDAHLPQLLERYEKSSTKMLDRWSVMVFERDIGIAPPVSTRTPKMSISHHPDQVLFQYEDEALGHLQSIVTNEDTQTMLQATRDLVKTVNDFITRVIENSSDEEQLSIKCDILRQKLGMLLDTLKEEEAGLHGDDELIRTLKEIAQKSASQRPIETDFLSHRTIEKQEKDKLNSRERTSRLDCHVEKEAVLCRANSLKRAIHDVLKYSETSLLYVPPKRLSIPMITKETSPGGSPIPVSAPLSSISPSVSTSRLTCISPLPDLRRDSMDEQFLSNVNLPVPKQFADGGSRRGSGIPENKKISSIEELEETQSTHTERNGDYNVAIARLANIEENVDNHCRDDKDDTLNQKSITTTTSDSQSTTAPYDFSFESDTKTVKFEVDANSAFERLGFKPFKKTIEHHHHQLQQQNSDPSEYVHFQPIEVYERNLYRNQQQQLQQQQQQQKQQLQTGNGRLTPAGTDQKGSNMLQVPSICLPTLEKPPENMYFGDNITIIDTDMPERSSSDEAPEEASDIISAISNEEYSLTSDILDRPSESNSHLPIGESIQDTDHFSHIDSPETSDTTEALHGESLMDDISSVLGIELLGALQDNTITEDTTTLCTLDHTKRRSFKIKHQQQQQQLQQQQQQQRKGSMEPEQCGFENRAFNIDNRCDDQKVREPRYCSLAKFVEGNDIARKSFKRPAGREMPSRSLASRAYKVQENEYENTKNLAACLLQPHGSPSDMSGSDTDTVRTYGIEYRKLSSACTNPDEDSITEYDDKDDGSDEDQDSEGAAGGQLDDDDDDEMEDEPDNDEQSHEMTGIPTINVVVEPPSPAMSDELRSLRVPEIRRHSSHTPNMLAPREMDVNRRHSGNNPNLLGLDSEHIRFLNCSPAATRRISSGSLLFKPEALGSSKSNIFSSNLRLFNFDGDAESKEDEKKKKEEKEERVKKLPIINPLVRLPSWPNVTSGTGFISKCLLANADTLCAAVSPLMDPDETLMEGYMEKAVMNNYFGIGIDAKISLDFHNKREEHPEKCRSRAKNYMWYGVLGSKQWLQKTYKNLEQKVQLECDGQRIPLPSLQGIVILNIPSFMGGTNFWGNKKEDDCFLAQSFDDRILEVVAVFGSVQMAASRLINLQHHRIAQCQSIQINILGEECVPIQVDGEAWLQPPGMIRIIHKNRVQMLCRNRSLEMSLKSWQEKQRQHSISIAREQPSTASSENMISMSDDIFSDRESYLLLNFIECVSTLVKWVKFLIISHPSLQPDLYMVASKTAEALESIHPGGKIIEGPDLRRQLTELVRAARQLYEDTCDLLRERSHSLILREDLETKLSVSLANMEMELGKCSLQQTSDGDTKVYLNVLAPNEDVDHRKKQKPFWLRFRGHHGHHGHHHHHHHHHPGAAGGAGGGGMTNADLVSSWGVGEVVTWLEAMQLSEYVDSFIKNDIRGKELLTLARRDLKDLGVTKVGHVKRILQAIKDLGSAAIG